MAGVQTVSRRLPGSVGGRRVAWHRRHGPKRAVITAAAEERLERQDRYNHESRRRQAGVCVDSDRAGQRGRKSWAAVLDAVPPCARRVALEQLLRIDDDGAYAGLVFGSPDSSSAEPDASDQQVERRERHLCQARSSLDDRDARFVTELVSGVVRWRRRLDYVISVLTNRSSTDIEPMMLQVLRMGLYELVVLRSPPHVINEHVELVKAVVRPEAASFANGVLRTASRKIASGTLPEVQVGQLTTAVKTSKEIRKCARLLGIAHSHPTWMVARWLRQLGGPATQRLLEWNNRRPLYGLRLNTLRGVDQNTFKNLPVLQEQAEAAGVELKLLPSPFLPREFLRVERGLQKILHSGLVADGTCSVQDEAAGLVVAMLDPQPGEKLLDACAAPGGKCLFAGMRMGGEGSLTAVDISARRLDAVLAAAEVQGLRHMVRAVPGDLREMPRERLLPAGSGGFDRVLLDAPCSGTGVLARRADLRWRRTKEQLADLEGLQDQLLDAAAALVRPGGLLVYSTCSIEPEENALRIRSFLSRHSGFRLAAPPEGVPVAVLVEPGVLQTMPFAHGIDGAFAARLQRCEGGTV